MQHLKNSNVYLYCAWFDEKKLAQYMDDTTAADKQRAARLIRVTDQKKWLFARAVLRHVLSQYLSCSPRDIVFENNSHGKPFVRDTNVQFNVSHSGECALIGVTLHHDIGVDVEKVRENHDILALAKRFFSHSEFLAIQSSENLLDAFYHCWTQKEAFIKATGLGLSFGLSHFEINVSSDTEHASTLLTVKGDAQLAKQWCVRSVVFPHCGRQYFASFAVHHDPLNVISEFFSI